MAGEIILHSDLNCFYASVEMNENPQLRGKAVAGARGLTEARVFALALEPELVSIAGVYRTAETPWPDAVRGKPAQVRLASGPDGDKLLLEPLS